MNPSAVDQPAPTFGPETLRAVLRNRPHPYEGMDVEEARRIGGVLCIVTALLIPLLGWASAPTEAIGEAGWVVAAGVGAVYLVFAFMMLRPGARVGYDGLLVINWIGIAQVAALEWLAGGAETPYQLLFLAPGVLPPSIHPPRRAIPLLAGLTVAIFLPLLYDGWNGGQAAQMALLSLFIWTFALMLMALTNAVRDQRLVLLSEGEAANRLARRDELTGLANRRAFDETLEHEIARSRRSGSPISILILDLVGFKSINDDHGHLAGDRALKEVAAAIRETTRVPDDCFRWGGDEFALVLPDTPRAGAIETGERLGRAVAACERPGGEGPVEICFGAAELSREQTADQLLDEADRRLVEAKRAA